MHTTAAQNQHMHGIHAATTRRQESPVDMLSVLRGFLLAILRTYHQRRNACTVYPGRIAINAHTIRQHLQPTPKTATPANVQTVNRPAATLDKFANDPATQGQPQRIQ